MPAHQESRESDGAHRHPLGAGMPFAGHSSEVAERAHVRLAELEERMQFLSRLETSLKELHAGDQEHRLQIHTDSAGHSLMNEAGSTRSQNPSAHGSEGMEVALPGAVDGGSDSEEESSSAAGSQQIEEPLRGKQMFFRQSSGIEEKAQTVEDMNVAQLRNIIKDEVVEKVRELGIVGRGHGNIGHTDRSEDIIHIDPHKTASRDHLPRNLAQAVPVAIPWFFGGFSRQSPIRMKCLQVSRDESWNVFFLLTLMANCAYIAIVPDDPNLTSDFWVAFDWICNAIYAFEIMCNIIAYGFIGHNAWFSVSFFHQIEFAVFCATIVEITVISLLQLEGLTAKPFRLLRVVKQLVTMKTFASVRIVLDTLSGGSVQLFVVMLMFVFFLFIGGIFGMQILMYSFRSRCVTDSHLLNHTACSSDFSTDWKSTCDFKIPDASSEMQGGLPALRGVGYAGAAYEGTACNIYCFTKDECKEMEKIERSGSFCSDGCEAKFPADTLDDFGNFRYPRDRWGRVHSCTMPNAYCSPNFGNPMYGLQHFDNIGGFVPTMLQMAVPDSHYAVMHHALQAEPGLTKPLTYVFVLSCTVILTWLMLGLFVAVITGTFQRVREKYRAERIQEAVGHANTGDELDDTQQFDNRPITAAAQFQAKAKRIVEESEFPVVMSGAVVVHIIAIIVEVQTPHFKPESLLVQYAAHILFALEIGLSTIAHGGVARYLKVASNQTELVLIILSVLSFVPGCHFLAAFASFRIFRLMRYFDTLDGLIVCSFNSSRSILNLVLFIGMLCLCFAITGRYIFGNKMNDNTRSHFGSNGLSLLTIFQLLIGDSWSSVLYEGVRVSGEAYNQIFAASFIILWFCFSKLIVSNIFVAVIIENFRVTDTIEAAGRPGNITKFRTMLAKSYESIYAIQLQNNIAHVGGNRLDIEEENIMSEEFVNQKKPLSYSLQAEDVEGQGDSELQFRSLAKNPHLRQLVLESVAQHEESEKVRAHRNRADFERILFCIGPDSLLKQFFQRVVKHWMFDAIIYIVIAAGCFILVTTPPYEDIPDNQAWLSFDLRVQLEWAFTGIFTIEFVARVVTQGLLFTENAYLKDNWNRIDVTVLFFAWVDITGVLEGTSFARVLRVMRGLKPLRMIKRLKGLRLLIDALLRTMLPVFYVLFFLTCIMLVFAVVGMGLFARKMDKCNDAIFAAYPGGKRDCASFFITDSGIMMPRSWERPKHNFDSIDTAFITLFRITYGKYVAVLYDTMDITDVELSPKQEASTGHALFLVAYVIVSTLFVMNLLVAFIVDGFNANRDSSEQEIQYRRFLRHVQTYMPKSLIARPPNNELSVYLQSVATGATFSRVSIFCVLSNVLLQLSDHADPTPGWLSFVYVLDLIFFLELWGEVLINLLGYGVGGYFSDLWKVFDLFVVSMSTLGYLFSSADQMSVVVRAARAFRIVRLMRMIEALRTILETIVSAVPQLINIIGLLILVLIMFAAMAMQLYSTTKSGVRFEGGKVREGSGVKTASFERFEDALTTLYLILVGDEWHQIMDDNSVAYPECTPLFAKSNDPSDSMFYFEGEDRSWGDCGMVGNFASASYFFPFFVVFCQSVMLNLVIGMILDNFSFITDQVGQVEDPDWSGGATASQIRHLANIFSLFCLQSGGRASNQYLPLWSITALLRELPEPIGFRQVENPQVILWGGKERVADKLIRAQLNIYARARRARWQEATKSSTGALSYISKKVLLLFTSNREYDYLEYTDFHEFILTAICWRKPSMLPEWIKSGRRKMFKEIIHTFSALIIRDALAQGLSLRHRKETNRALASKSEFRRWSDRDEHYVRRMRFRRQRKAARARKSEDNYLFRNIEEVPPVAALEIVLESLDDIPPDMIPHHESLRWEGHQKFPRPRHGVEWFLKQAARNKVVLRFIDARNMSKGIVLADFTKCDWEGWIPDGGDHEDDYLFMPEVAKARVDLEDTNWAEVKLLITASAKAGGGRKKKKSAGEDRILPVGSILDVQGCRSFSTANAKGLPQDPVSIVRLNMGSFFFNSLRKRPEKLGYLANLLDMQRRAGEGMKSMKELRQKRLSETKGIVAMHTQNRIVVHDGVLEVVGYMGTYDAGDQELLVAVDSAHG